MIFDSVPQTAPRRPPRAILFAAAAAIVYPAMFALAAHMPPLWLLFRDWDAPRPELRASWIVDPPPRHSRARTSRPAPAASPKPRRVAPFPVLPAPRQASLHVAAIEGTPPRSPARIAASVRPDFERNRTRYETLGREEGIAPRIVIDSSFDQYAPVMRAYDAELALGLSYPAPNRNTYLYSMSRGTLRQGVPAAGATPRRVRTALAVDGLKEVVRDVADRLGAGAESIQVYALYPEALHFGLLGKVREVLARIGAPPDACAVVSFVPLPKGFDVEVKPLASCP